MRVSLPYQVKEDLAERIAATLKLHLLKPAYKPDPATGLLSDNRVIAHITNVIADYGRGAADDCSFLLNGYPQTIIQAQSLDIALAQKGLALTAAVVSDTPKTLESRENRALIRYYRSQNKLILLENTSNTNDICSKIVQIHEKRRTPAVIK